ncbi:ParB/RepB/Spo0J family partition protein [Burkholderia sp. LMG 13014]|uniref:ParB/RepB/Spo0J family partition protein n=1 Tax=Burkholderia sp. LMG 13014 TaxID=2709306 RepID=UPI001964169E|nr:ParB/RepB/Spo0J family partition protein [Burkholderia sp. LMG 13014]
MVTTVKKAPAKSGRVAKPAAKQGAHTGSKTPKAAPQSGGVKVPAQSKPGSPRTGAGSKAGAQAGAELHGLAVATGFVRIPLDRIEFDPEQPRQDFYPLDGKVDPEVQRALQGLAAELDAEGLQHPITVREKEPGSSRYVVVVGERRTRAAMLNGWKEIDGRIRNDLSGARLRIFQLAENIQRESLSESDTAVQVAKLVAEGMPKQDIARAFNQPPAWVTRYLAFADVRNRELYVKPGYFTKAWILYRFLRLPEHIQERAIEGLNDPERESRELTSEELKRLENYAREEKEQAARKAALGAVGEGGVEPVRGGVAMESAPQSAAVDGAAAAAALFGDADGGDDGGYRPPPASALARSAEVAAADPAIPRSYAQDDAQHDFSGTGPLATSMQSLPASATSVVSVRVSVAQLAGALGQLRDLGDAGAVQLGELATEFRIEAPLLRNLLKAMGVTVEGLPDQVLPLKLAELGQRLVKGQA